MARHRLETVNLLFSKSDRFYSFYSRKDTFRFSNLLHFIIVVVIKCWGIDIHYIISYLMVGCRRVMEF